MNYEKAYKEALERARDLHDNHPYGEPPVWTTCEKIFPELRESEDERIRKEVKAYINRHYPVDSPVMNKSKILNWLEKQGKKSEYNPYKVTVESIAEMCKNYSTSTDLHDFYDNVKVKCKDAVEYDKIWTEKQGEQNPSWSEEDEKFLNYAISLTDDAQIKNFLKSLKDRVQLKPKQEWSEEDEDMIECIIAAIKMGDYYTQDELNRMTSWLKSLKPNHWKPSEEQMEELEYVTRGNSYPHLTSLYQDLKNL